MTDSETPTAQDRPVQRLAVVAIIAGLGAIILLATLPNSQLGWAAVAGVAGIVAAIVSVIDATRAGRDASWLAIVGALTGLVALIMVFFASM